MRAIHFFTVCLSIGLLLSGNLALPISAREYQPTRRGLPGRREGAGTRGPAQACVAQKPTLTTILPETNLGLTTTDYPRLFVFMPQTSAKTARLVLFASSEANPEDDVLYDTTLTIPPKASILSVQLPKDGTIPPLEIDKNYHWVVTLQCNPADPVTDIYVSGWVRRVALPANLNTQLQATSPRDRLQLYTQNDVWLDAVATMSDLRCTDPTNPDLAANWQELLQSVNLGHLAKQPLAQCAGITASKAQP